MATGFGRFQKLTVDGDTYTVWLGLANAPIKYDVYVSELRRPGNPDGFIGQVRRGSFLPQLGPSNGWTWNGTFNVRTRKAAVLGLLTKKVAK